MHPAPTKRKRTQLSERYIDDADWATAAEQSSEDDEAQEGNILAEEDRANTPAEHLAVHIVDEDEDDLSDLDDIDIDDPEADAIVNDALNIDKANEAEAAAEVLTDSLAEEVAAYAAVHADDVTPYNGPDINGDEDEPVLDEDFVAEVDAAAGVVDDVEASVDAADAATVEGDLDVADPRTKTPTRTRTRRSAPSCARSPASGTSSTPTRASSAR